jgi:putative intracellular protease/amidase
VTLMQKTRLGLSTNCHLLSALINNYVGQKVMPFRIEDEARKLGANFISGGLFKPFAARDGRLITGQQQFSGVAAARLLIEALGV